jgi:hypothetical protein
VDLSDLEIPFRFVEIIYYGTVWFVACASGVSRALRGNPRFICRDFISIGFCSGFLGVAVVSLRDYAGGGFDGSQWGGIGLAALIGLAGKEQELIVRVLWRSIMKKLGVPDSAFEENTPPMDDRRMYRCDNPRDDRNLGDNTNGEPKP